MMNSFFISIFSLFILGLSSLMGMAQDEPDKKKKQGIVLYPPSLQGSQDSRVTWPSETVTEEEIIKFKEERENARQQDEREKVEELEELVVDNRDEMNETMMAHSDLLTALTLEVDPRIQDFMMKLNNSEGTEEELLERDKGLNHMSKIKEGVASLMEDWTASLKTLKSLKKEDKKDLKVMISFFKNFIEKDDPHFKMSKKQKEQLKTALNNPEITGFSLPVWGMLNFTTMATVFDQVAKDCYELYQLADILKKVLVESDLKKANFKWDHYPNLKHCLKEYFPQQQDEDYYSSYCEMKNHLTQQIEQQMENLP